MRKIPETEIISVLDDVFNNGNEKRMNQYSNGYEGFFHLYKGRFSVDGKIDIMRADIAMAQKKQGKKVVFLKPDLGPKLRDKVKDQKEIDKKQDSQTKKIDEAKKSEATSDNKKPEKVNENIGENKEKDDKNTSKLGNILKRNK